MTHDESVEKDLACLAAGELPEEQAGRLLEHIQGCEKCHRILEEFRELGRLGAEAAVPELAAPAVRQVLARIQHALAVERESSGATGTSEVMTLDEVARFLRIDIGVERYVLADSLTGILAQRLVRRLCPGCRRPDADGAARLTAAMGVRVPGSPTVFASGGCDRCHGTGYRGRQAIFELVAMTRELRAVLHVLQDLAVALYFPGGVNLRMIRDIGHFPCSSHPRLVPDFQAERQEGPGSRVARSGAQ